MRRLFGFACFMGSLLQIFSVSTSKSGTEDGDPATFGGFAEQINNL
ncbi:MAG: hypothetical protein ACI9PY_002620 [Ascidiaceihabitans sp.]